MGARLEYACVNIVKVNEKIKKKSFLLKDTDDLAT